MNQVHFAKLENMYLAANINQSFFETTQIKIKENTVEIKLEITEKYHHALGAMHGSVYFKLLDDACFFAASSIVEEVFVLTSSFNIHFTRPVSNGWVIAEAKVKHYSKNLIVTEASLFNMEGKEIAFGTGNFIKSKIPLSPGIGYK